MNLKLLLLLIIGPFLNAQINLENTIFQLEEYNDALTIQEVVKKEEQGLFNRPFPIEIFKFIKGKEANWICINVTKQTEKQYISIENSLFEELNFYLYEQRSISTPIDLKKNNDNRFPTIEIFPKNTPCKIFIRSKDALSYRTEFTIGTYNEKEFRRKTQKDYFFIGAYSLGLTLLITTSTFFLLYKREYSVLFYTMHLIMILVEYLINIGIISQWFLSNTLIQKYNLDHISLLAVIYATTEFFRNYFSYTKKTRICKYVYLVISIFCVAGLIYAIIDIIIGNKLNIEWYTQNLLIYAAFLSFITYVILAIYKVIPVYLLIAFLLPVSGILANNGNYWVQYENPNISFLVYQSIYIGVLIQLIVMVFYIMKQSIDGELKAISLAKENNELKISFDEELAINQEKHQNALMNDVHDSFGGYIEALKLTLINKNIKESAVNEILDSFITDYRLLLNSLYVPNVNAENFIGSIEAYCNKMNSLSEIDINFKTEKNNHADIPQNIAKFAYKAALELTTNSIKYAKASEINVSLLIDDAQIILKVIDNGIGFIENEIKPTSFGINGIKERSKTFDGSFKIDSKIKKGSSLTLILPIPETSD